MSRDHLAWLAQHQPMYSPSVRTTSKSHLAMNTVKPFFSCEIIERYEFVSE